MAEYIDIDKAIVVIDTRGTERETTVRHILDINKGVYKIDDVQPVRHGRWYRFQKVYIDPQTGMGFAQDMYKCDVCNVGEEETRKPYCPECGAKMDGET